MDIPNIQQKGLSSLISTHGKRQKTGTSGNGDKSSGFLMLRRQLGKVLRQKHRPVQFEKEKGVQLDMLQKMGDEKENSVL